MPPKSSNSAYPNSAINPDPANDPTLYIYTVTIDTTAYTVQPGDTVDGNIVTNDWNSILTALEFLVEQRVGFSVAIDAANRALTISGPLNTTFTFAATFAQQTSTPLPGGVENDGSQPVQQPGANAQQESSVAFNVTNATPDGNDIYEVVVNGNGYQAQVGDNAIIDVTGLSPNATIEFSGAEPVALPGIGGVVINAADIADPRPTAPSTSRVRPSPSARFTP